MQQNYSVIREAPRSDTFAHNANVEADRRPLVDNPVKAFLDFGEPMRNKREPEEFMRDMRERQHSYVFPDTVRNSGGFWRGIFNQKLKGFQWFGLIFVVAFQIGIFAVAVRLQWPQGPDSTWEKIVYGYGPYLLLSLPLIAFLTSQAQHPKEVIDPIRDRAIA